MKRERSLSVMGMDVEGGNEGTKRGTAREKGWGGELGRKLMAGVEEHHICCKNGIKKASGVFYTF